MNFFPPRNNSP